MLDIERLLRKNHSHLQSSLLPSSIIYRCRNHAPATINVWHIASVKRRRSTQSHLKTNRSQHLQVQNVTFMLKKAPCSYLWSRRISYANIALQHYLCLFLIVKNPSMTEIPGSYTFNFLFLIRGHKWLTFELNTLAHKCLTSNGNGLQLRLSPLVLNLHIIWVSSFLNEVFNGLN